MTNAVEQLEKAVNALKDEKASKEALDYLKEQIDRLNDLVPFIVTSGGDMSEVKSSARRLMKTLGIDAASKATAKASKKGTADFVVSDVKVWMNKNAKGVGNAVSKSAIERGVLGEGRVFKLHQWNGHGGKTTFKCNGDTPNRKYYV